MSDALAAGRALLAAGDGFHAHEAWEAVWRQLPAGPEKRAVQGLIQLAVALEHHRRGNLRSAAGQWAKAQAKLAEAPAWPDLPVGALLDAVAPCLDAAAREQRLPAPDLRWFAG